MPPIMTITCVSNTLSGIPARVCSNVQRVSTCTKIFGNNATRNTHLGISPPPQVSVSRRRRTPERRHVPIHLWRFGSVCTHKYYVLPLMMNPLYTYGCLQSIRLVSHCLKHEYLLAPSTVRYTQDRIHIH